LADDYQTTLAQLEASLQVQHVAHRPLTTVSATAAMGQAQAIAASQTLNNLPVVDDSDGIVGVLENLNGEIKDYPRPRVDVRAVRHAMRPLVGRMLVECRCSLEGLLTDLVVPPYYQLVVTAGQIDGIVTVADLNKAPVRVMAYATVAHLETAMANAIRNRTNGDDKVAVAMLGPDSAAQVSDAHRRLREGYLNADLLDATTFKQKGVILAELGVFGQSSSSTVKREFEGLYERLRNPLMHMSPFVAESIDGLRDFVADLEQARRRTHEAVAATA
jgi:predicted transcriptional regulator